MTVTYEVNSNAFVAGIQASWAPIETGQETLGLPKYSAWFRHFWAVRTMETAEYLILQALRGAAFSELKTTDEATPNSTGTYSTGRVVAVAGRQEGRQMRDVRVEFLVDTS